MRNDLINIDEYLVKLVDKYADMVLRLALTYLKNMADAEDICQSVFIKIYEQNKRFIDPDHEKAWIIRVTINACKDTLKSQWKKWFLPVEKVDLPIKDEESREIVSLVLDLPVKYRTVIYLFYFENYSTAEIASLLNRNEATVRTQLKRARESLKEIAGVWGNE